MKALLAGLVLVLLTACNPYNTKSRDIVHHEPVEVTKRILVGVRSELTAPLPCYERKDDSVREYVNQAESNTATCKTANAHRQAIRDSHPEE